MTISKETVWTRGRELEIRWNIQQGLAGWVQINGRDELSSFCLYIKCFHGSLGVFVGYGRFVEGGNWEKNIQEYEG